MKISPRCPISSGAPSFALISVLALVSLAALTATAFLATARLERRATMPLTQSTTLEMALHAGSVAAMEMLDYAPSKHFNFVTTCWRGNGPNDWTNELGYLLSGAVQSTSVKTSTIYNFYACFSTATLTNLGTNATDLVCVSNNVDNQGTFQTQIAAFMTTNTNGFVANPDPTNPICTRIPLLGDATSPPVGWVYINQDKRIIGTTNTTNVSVVRFAFFAQDLCGMMDAERMGGASSRDTGTNPTEISLTNASGSSLTNSALVTSLTSSTNRRKYLSPGMLLLSNAGNLTTNDLRYVTTGLRHWTNAWERIPVGLGYRDSWAFKLVLNDTSFTNTSIGNTTTLPNTLRDAAANLIARNMQTFTNTNRSGGMDGGRYLNALAVNMQDYVDADIDPTTNGSGSTAVRGVEPLPFITETATSMWWFNHGTNIPGFTGQIADEIHLANYVELWNLSDRPFSGNLTVSFSNSLSCGSVNGVPIDLTFTSNSASRTWTNTLGSAHPHTNVISVNPPLAPNEYRAFFLGTNIYRFLILNTPTPEGNWYNGQTATNGFLRLGATNNPLSDSFVSSVSVAYNGVVYDRATNLHRVGSRTLYCRAFASGNNANPDWAGNVPALRLTPTNLLPLPGDPRIGFYLTCTNNAQGYASANPNYGNSMGWRNRGVSSAGVTFETRPSAWLDGGYTNSPYMPTNVTDANFPDINRHTNAFTNEFVQKFNNTGTWSNVFELGNIFDPLAWGVPTNSSSITTSHTAAGNGSGNVTNGGGTTLRIGRAEHQRFAFTNLPGASIATPNMMASSAALLDLFCCGPANTITNRVHLNVDYRSIPFDESGQINLNTAPAPVLRALAGSVRLTNDSAMVPAGLSISNAMAEAFAQGVMRFRAQYPFYSPSQLSFIGTDPAWPNTNTWPNNTVFGNTNTISLANIPGNVSGGSASLGVSRWGDQAAEEWFQKIYKLSTTQSRNFRVYVVAQLVDSNKVAYGPVVRKYYHVVTRQNSDSLTNIPAASGSTLRTFESPY